MLPLETGTQIKKIVITICLLIILLTMEVGQPIHHTPVVCKFLAVHNLKKLDKI